MLLHLAMLFVFYILVGDGYVSRPKVGMEILGGQRVLKPPLIMVGLRGVFVLLAHLLQFSHHCLSYLYQ